MKRRVVAALSLTCFLSVAGVAYGESEWTGESPPPLDFGLQVTAPPSAIAPYAWLRSVDGGTAIEASWNAEGVNTAQLANATGGAADGMHRAVSVRSSTSS